MRGRKSGEGDDLQSKNKQITGTKRNIANPSAEDWNAQSQKGSGSKCMCSKAISEQLKGKDWVKH